MRAHSKTILPRGVKCLAFASALGVAVAMTGCKDDEKGAAADPAAPASVKTVDGLNLVGGGGKSPHFDAVASHLQVGGTVFGYVDVDGDVEKIVGMIQKLMDAAPDGELPPHIDNLDLGELMREIGLDGIEAMGMSSYKNGDLYHNRAYVHVPGGREGFLKMLGGDPAPFVASSLAPADADMVVEQTLNIRAAYEVVSKLVMRLGGEDAYGEFRSEMSEVNPQLGLAMADLLGKLDTRMTMFARLHPDKPLEIPDVPVEIPSFDFLLALDDVSWLYEKVTGNMKKEMPADQAAQMFVKGDGFEKIALPPMPSPEMVIVQPVIYHDIANKRVLVASTQTFLDECLSGKTKLADGAGFKAATAGLPTEGNGLSYVSAEFMGAVRKLVDSAIEAGVQGGIGQQEALILSTIAPLIVGAEVGQGKVTVNEKDGIFVSSNSSMSMKEGLLMSGAPFLAALGATTYARKLDSSIPSIQEEPHAHEHGPEVEEIPIPSIPRRE